MIGSNAFNNVIFRGAGSKTFGANAASTTNFTVESTSGTVTFPSTLLSIAGNYTNNGTIAHNSGTVYLSGDLRHISGFDSDGSAAGTLGAGIFPITISGNYAYVGNTADATACSQSAGSAAGCELQVYDISDPENPVYVAGRDSDGSAAGTLGPTIRSIAISGNYAYVGKFTDATACSQSAGSADGCEFMVFDISTPTNPVYVAGRDSDGSADGTLGPSIRTIVISGNYAYMAKNPDATACSQSAGSADGCEFMVFDISTPTNPVYVAGRDTDGSADGTLGSPVGNDVAVSGNYAYFAKSFDSTGCSSVAGSGDGCEFMVFDISTPTNPVYVAGLDSSGSNSGALGPAISSIAISGNYAYLGKGVDTTACSQSAGSADGCEFTIFDISTPSNPTFVTGLDSDGSASGTLGPSIFYITVSGNYAYTGKSTDATACSQSAGSADGCEFMVFDISTPTNPVYVAGRDSDGSADGTLGPSMFSIATTSNYAYLGKGVDTTACSQSAGSADGCELLVLALGNNLSGNMTGISAFNNTVFKGDGNKLLNNHASTSNLTIDANSGHVTPLSNVLSVSGSFINNATAPIVNSFNTPVLFDGGSQTLSGTVKFTGAVQFLGSGTKTISANASTTNFTIGSGVTVAAPTLLSIAGNYTNNGTFTQSSGTTTFDGTTAQTLSGTMTGTSAFKNLAITNSSATTTFAASASTTGNFFASTTNVRLEFAPDMMLSTDSNFVVHGTSGGLVNLFSTTPNSTWYISANGGTAVTYARVQDSNACAHPIDASTGGTNVDAGLNSCWFFAAAPLLFSDANQEFTFGDSSTPISLITVSDFTTPTITAANDLRIAIGTSTTHMLWDTSDTSAVIGGTASAKVTGTVTYEGGGSVLVVPVNTNFASGETLTISGLNFTSFTAASAPLPGLKLFNGGISDQTADATNNKTVTIKGTVTGAEHSSSQATNAFSVSNSNATDAILYAFKLTLAGGEQMSVSEITLALENVFGVFADDFTSTALFIDYDGDKTIDAGDTQVGGTGSLSISGESGTLVFSSAFTATTTRDYLLRASVSSIEPANSVAFVLTPAEVTASGLTSLLVTTPASTIALSKIQHARFPRGGVAVGGDAPAGQGVVGGGGQDGGESIGSDPDFIAPTTSGGTFNQWTTPDNAFASDGSYATAATSYFREDYGGFGFSIPDSNTIQGIEVKLELSGTTAAGTVSVALSWDGGTSTTTTVYTSDTLTTSDAVVTLGGPSNTWGRTWSPSEFSNSNFKVRVIAQPSGNTVRVDAIQVNVHDVAGGGGQGGGGMVVVPRAQYLANVYGAGQGVLKRLVEKLQYAFISF